MSLVSDYGDVDEDDIVGDRVGFIRHQYARTNPVAAGRARKAAIDRALAKFCHEKSARSLFPSSQANDEEIDSLPHRLRLALAQVYAALPWPQS